MRLRRAFIWGHASGTCVGILLVVIAAAGLVACSSRNARAPVGSRPAGALSTPTSAEPSASIEAPSITAGPITSGPEDAHLRGLLQATAWWDAQFHSATTAQCSAVGESDPGAGWVLPTGALACIDMLSLTSDTWGRRIVNVDVFFPGPVSQAAAEAQGLSLLPTDTTLVGSYPGVNNDVSAVQNGSCLQVVYTSATLKLVVMREQTTWTDADLASIAVYSGPVSTDNGAERPYRADSVRVEIVGIGGANRGADGIVHC